MRVLFKIIPVLLAGGLLMSSCTKADASLNISKEIRTLVQELKPSTVDEYLYHSDKVYFFDTWSGPDDITHLFSSQGEELAQFGGFTGKGDGRCTDFGETATFIRTVYSNNRWAPFR